jgi:hypothetical protein
MIHELYLWVSEEPMTKSSESRMSRDESELSYYKYKIVKGMRSHGHSGHG